MNWIKGFNPAVVAKAMERIVDRSVPGRAAFKGFEIDDLEVLLKSMFTFPDQISDHEKDGVVWSAIKGAARFGPITDSSLLRELRKAASNLLRTARSTYVVVSTISLKSGDFQRTLTI